MTTIDEAREAVYQAFDAGWGSRTLRQLEGVKFDEPGVDVEWIRVVVRNLTGTTETMGDVDQKKHRRNALVLMSVFTPAEQGMKSAAEHAQFALDIFESKNVTVPGGSERLDFIAGDVREIPLDEDDKSRMTEVEVPFDYTQTK
jgi:hypothetical protein